MRQSLYNWFYKPFLRYAENDFTRRLIKNSGYLLSSTGISAALSMLQGILVARLLGVESFGLLGTITMFTSVVNKLLSFRMGELVVRYVGLYNEEHNQPKSAAVYKSAVLVEMLTSIFAFTLLLLIAPLAARFLAKDISATYLFRIYAFLVLANLTYESSLGLLQIYDRFNRIAAIHISQSLINVTLVGVIYFMEGDLVAVLLAYLIGKSIGAIGISTMAFMEAFHMFGKRWLLQPINVLKTKARELTHFAINTNISATISLVTKDSELLWVSFFRSPLETGYYKLALSLANIVQLPISPLPQTTYPELSRQVARENWNNMRQIMRQGSLIAGGYSFAATVGLAIVGPLLIALIYTPEYLPAYPALLILLVGYLVANTFYWRRAALLSLGQPNFPTKVNLILAALKVVGIIIFVPKYGYLASAALLSSFYIAGSIIYVLKIRTLIPQSVETA